MEESQLIELIKSIKPEEKEHLLEFAMLRFFNNGRMRAQIRPLLDICLNHPWHDPEQKLEKMEVYTRLFPDQPFVEGKLEKVMVEAQKIIRSFLLNNYYFRSENEFYQVLDFTEILRLRSLNSRYQLSMARLKKIQEEFPWRNAQYFHKQFLLDGAIHYRECLNNQSRGDLNISNLLRATEIHYHLRRVALLNRYLLQLRVTKLDTPPEIKLQLEEMLVPRRYLDELPTLKINFEIFTILKKEVPEAIDIRLLFDLVKNHETNFDGETLQKSFMRIT